MALSGALAASGIQSQKDKKKGRVIVAPSGREYRWTKPGDPSQADIDAIVAYEEDLVKNTTGPDKSLMGGKRDFAYLDTGIAGTIKPSATRGGASGTTSAITFTPKGGKTETVVPGRPTGTVPFSYDLIGRQTIPDKRTAAQKIRDRARAMAATPTNLMKEASSGISQAIGNGPIRDEFYQGNDANARVARALQGIANIPIYANPVTAPVLIGAQAADVGGSAVAEGIGPTVKRVANEANPFAPGLNTEDRLFRAAGILGAAFGVKYGTAKGAAALDSAAAARAISQRTGQSFGRSLELVNALKAYEKAGVQPIRTPQATKPAQTAKPTATPVPQTGTLNANRRPVEVAKDPVPYRPGVAIGNEPAAPQVKVNQPKPVKVEEPKPNVAQIESNGKVYTLEGEAKTAYDAARARYEAETARISEAKAKGTMNAQEASAASRAVKETYSKAKRDITGELTEKEAKAQAAEATKITQGKPVLVDGKPAKVARNPVQGKVLVEFEDGSRANVEYSRVKLAQEGRTGPMPGARLVTDPKAATSAEPPPMATKPEPAPVTTVPETPGAKPQINAPNRTPFATGKPQEAASLAPERPTAPEGRTRANAPQTPSQGLKARRGAPEPQEGVTPLNTSRADLDKVREEYGMQTIPDSEAQSIIAWQKEAQTSGKVKTAGELAKKIIDKPRPLDKIEQAAFKQRAQELRNRIKELEENTLLDPDVRRKEHEKAWAELDDISRAARHANTEWGRSGVAIQVELANSYDSVSIRQRAKTQKGSDLTPEQDAAFRQKANQDEALDKAIKERESKLAAQGERLAKQEAQLKKQDADLKRVQADLIRANQAKRSVARADRVKGAQSRRQKATQELMRLSGRTSAGIDPAAAKHLYDIALSYAEEGVVRLADVADRVVTHVRASGLNYSADQVRRAIAEGRAEKLAERRNKLKDPELEKLKDRRAVLRKQIDRDIDSLKPRSVIEHVENAVNSTRSLLATGDMSAIFRQAAVLTINPLRAKATLQSSVRAFKAMMTEEGAARVMRRMESDPMFEKAQKAGLEFGDWSGAIGKGEESFAGRFAVRFFGRPIPGNPLSSLVKGSDRHMTTFLNEVRFEAFKGYARFVKDPAELARYADWLNIATGRPKINPGRIAGSAFFSPKLFASRFIHTPSAIVKAAATPWKPASFAILTDFGAFAGTAFAIGKLMEANGYVVSFDPESPDFLKPKKGKERIDLLGGYAQSARYWLSLAKLAQKGDYYNAVKKTGDQLRFKAAPVPGTLISAAFRTDPVGKPFGAKEAARTFLPLGPKEAVEASQKEGIEKGIETFLRGFFGIGTQNY